MTAARDITRVELTDEQLDDLAERIAEKMRRKAPVAPHLAAEPTAEDYERMRRLLRRKGVRVRE